MTPRFSSPSALTFVALLCVCAAGCSAEVTDLELQEEFILEPSAVDILWVLDNAGTVIQLQDAVGAAFPSLVSSLESRSVDWQTAITTTDMLDPDHRGRLLPLASDGSPFLSAGQPDAAARFAQGARVGAEGAVVERGLESAWAAISPPLLHRDNKDFLRPDARLAVVFVGDDDDCSHEGRLVADTPEGCVANPDQLVPVSEYLVRFGALLAVPLDVSLHALVETGVTAEYEGCGGGGVSERIISAARSTGGFVVPYCDDLGVAFSELGNQIAGRRTAFPLQRRPQEDSIVVQAQSLADGAEGPIVIERDITMESGWTWDQASNSIRLWGDAVQPLGTSINIRYVAGLGG